MGILNGACEGCCMILRIGRIAILELGWAGLKITDWSGLFLSMLLTTSIIYSVGLFIALISMCTIMKIMSHYFH